MNVVGGAAVLDGKGRLDAATEQALVEQCRRQNFEAFGLIVDAYQARIHGFVRRLVSSPEEAQDLTQETFIRAYQGFARFDGRSSLRTWLFRIAYNLCVDELRRRDRSAVELPLEGLNGDDAPVDVADARWDPQAVLMNDELRAAAEEGIASMSEKLRSVLLLHDREGLAYNEIADLAGIPVGTVKSRLFLARSHLKAHLLRYLKGEPGS
jgi:RNA polymerase sigma-70 factor (ECF subfamily)